MVVGVSPFNKTGLNVHSCGNRPVLYDLTQDPNEDVNLAGSDHATVERLREHLAPSEDLWA